LIITVIRRLGRAQSVSGVLLLSVALQQVPSLEIEQRFRPLGMPGTTDSCVPPVPETLVVEVDVRRRCVPINALERTVIARAYDLDPERHGHGDAKHHAEHRTGEDLGPYPHKEENQEREEIRAITRSKAPTAPPLSKARV